jgi:hypothetical protein
MKMIEIGGQQIRSDATDVDLSGTPVSDIAPLESMPLKRLWLAGTPVSDIAPLEGMPLKRLWLAGTPAAKHPLPEWIPDECVIVGLDESE